MEGMSGAYNSGTNGAGDVVELINAAAAMVLIIGAAACNGH